MNNIESRIPCDNRGAICAAQHIIAYKGKCHHFSKCCSCGLFYWQLCSPSHTSKERYIAAKERISLYTEEEIFAALL